MDGTAVDFVVVVVVVVVVVDLVVVVVVVAVSVVVGVVCVAVRVVIVVVGHAVDKSSADGISRSTERSDIAPTPVTVRREGLDLDDSGGCKGYCCSCRCQCECVPMV